MLIFYGYHTEQWESQKPNVYHWESPRPLSLIMFPIYLPSYCLRQILWALIPKLVQDVADQESNLVSKSLCELQQGRQLHEGAISFVKSVSFIKCLKICALFFKPIWPWRNKWTSKWPSPQSPEYCMSLIQPVPVICQESFHDNIHQR